MPRNCAPVLVPFLIAASLAAGRPTGGSGSGRPADDELVAAVQACLASILQESDFQLGELTVSAAAGGGATVAGPAQLFGRDATLEATFTAARKMRALDLTLRDGAVSVGSLDRIGGGGLRRALGSLPLAESISLRRLAVAVADDGRRTPARC